MAKKILLGDAIGTSDKSATLYWYVPGLYIDIPELPANGHITKTFVKSESGSPYQVGVCLVDMFNTQSHHSMLYTIDTLDDLRQKHPQLFELEGYLSDPI